jgi:hypothetical protein
MPSSGASDQAHVVEVSNTRARLIVRWRLDAGSPSEAMARRSDTLMSRGLSDERAVEVIVKGMLG